MDWILLAPGPSMSQALADSLRGKNAGVIGNCYELAPWADFLAANDRAWWGKNPAAKHFEGRRFSSSKINDVEQHQCGQTNWNSGVLALDTAVSLGATAVRLYGFDMRGSHFFGPYTNGLTNTSAYRRELHQKQYQRWKDAHPDVTVENCTPGSMLQAFPYTGEQ